MTAIAFLGTGTMGAPMARNLVKAGFQVTAWNRTRDRAEGLVADSPAQAVEGADVVVTMLSDGSAVHEVMEQAAPGLRPGQVWVQMSTVGVAALDRLVGFAAERGLVFYDAPVQGTKQPAEHGKLVVLAAGPASGRPIVQPIFDAVGGRTLWLGAVGDASRLKLAGVSYGITATAIAGEAIALAKALGVDPAQFAELVTGGPMDSPYLQAKMKAIMAGDFTASFAVRNAIKDIGLIEEAARGAGVRVDMSVAAGERLRRAEAQGHGADDMAAAYFASFA
ncbi:NAD(P)-dependent oxidoreductase [Nonomuraea sp. NPDC050556]|uniref:NAD(P)-dependent oxidoreductase n=1 Tax=Nonomuraea sp. NPDC050556 TaxID=3364369 RepID=UPI0037B2E3BE